ncbi:hypothetical protein MDOR_36440 [Mycolicibacterium doricum]|uniref:Uncharacterized protein n=1 Tax=Mycolicibacterium doricum TaxID=126673 RepID=A0A1X1TPK0_9MYCO|nr:hypothetical protein [Mycolicibacterium doricum]MCV7269796.1 hypothetical protein [Mycolicibacterium doricum]ORV46389.1 hypothetical protein AWC01_00030 [Mycolicibacterium doricum]BBZ09475.1 hypothetical protein MDOR_36440 [Mycolicibacterium doricum]
MGGMADDPLDQLYAVAPDEFTALRSRLAADAKQRGDAVAAKRITGARKPTMSAAVVNRLVHGEPEVTERLGELGEELRAAHAAMDGHRIRELSGRQRTLIEQLTRAALEMSDIRSPASALRGDVTDTLHAAIADPDVRSRLGRLAQAEHWSGFGDTEMVFAEAPDKPAPKKAARNEETTEPENPPDRERRRRGEQARGALAAAQRAKADADDKMEDRHRDLASARLRVDDAKERLAQAEHALSEAAAAYEGAKRVSGEAGAVVKAAKASQRANARKRRNG